MPEDGISGHPPELLAPAGSMDALRAAVAAGADSVYLGGAQFGARRFARNFNESEMSEGISYAHLFGVKVYVTINTLVHDRELADLARYLLKVYQMGADAILVQDMGVASLAKALVPDLPIHASTQCTIASVHGVTWAKNKGFERIVLAREVNLADLDRILALPASERTGIEIFVHGALCYCYSGQCLLSSVIGGRSGNRGMCAQPCRKPYQLVTWSPDRYGRPEKIRKVPLSDQYLLSPRDLCLYPHLGSIVARSVDALKIEGRMRSPEYVAVAVSAYREALASAARGDLCPSGEVLEDLAIAFNRGFTGGYLMGDHGKRLMGRRRPDPCGLRIGTVVSCNHEKGGFAVRPVRNLVPQVGDGLVLISPSSGKETGFIMKSRVRSGDGMLHFMEPVECEKGMELFLTRSVHLSRKITEIGRRKVVTGTHPIPIDIILTLERGKRPLISGSFTGHRGQEDQVDLTAEFHLVAARDRPTTLDEIERQVKRAGDSHFKVRNLRVNYGGGLFIPTGALNKLRRDLLTSAEAAYLNSWLPGEHQVAEAQERLSRTLVTLGDLPHRIPGKKPKNPEIAVYADDLETIGQACSAGCHRICFEIAGDREHLLGSLERAKEECDACNIALVWKWPRIATDRFTCQALSLVPKITEMGIRGIMVDGFGMAEAILDRDPGIKVYGGTGLNVFNHLSVGALSPPFHQLTLSPELSAADIAILIACARMKGWHTPLEVLVQGNLEAMISEDDLLGILPAGFWQTSHGKNRFFGIKDERGRIFPVRRDDLGRTRISNSVETCLIDYIPDLIEMGIDSLSVDARGRGGVYAGHMVGLYSEAVALSTNARDGANVSESLGNLKESIKMASLGGITAGTFREGLVE